MFTLFDTSIPNIRRYFSEKELIYNYIGTLKPICSPFRTDKSPTITFKEVGDKIIWRDWKTGDNGDAFEFISRLEGVSREDVGKIIFKKFKYGFEKVPINTKVTYKNTSVDRKYAVQTRDFNEKDLLYWKRFNISKEILELFNVFAIETLYVEGNNGLFYKRIDNSDYCYGYKYKNWKIYQPFDDNDKWLFYGTLDEIEGWSQLPEKAELLIITKSLKDIMTLYSMGIPSISFQGERNIPYEQIISELKTRFKRIVLLYDNDPTGIESSNIISEIYELEQLFVPDEYGKDISEVVDKKGIEFGTALMDSIL